MQMTMPQDGRVVRPMSLARSLHELPLGMLTVFKRAFKDFNDDECSVRAAALAYYTVFALPPLLMLLIMVAGALWDPREVQRALEGQLAGLVGAEGGRAIHGIIESADNPTSGGPVAAVLGIAALLFGATGAFVQLQNALNRAWEVRPDPAQSGVRAFFAKRVLSLTFVLGVAFLLIVALAISALISAFGASLSFMPEPALQAIDIGLTLAVLVLLFAAIFKVVPDADVHWHDVWVGAAVTSALFVIGKFLIGLYLGRSSPGNAFGAASALAVMLVWVYYAGMIVLFGAEFTQAWAHHRGSEIRPEQGAVRIDRDDLRVAAGRSPRDEKRAWNDTRGTVTNDAAQRIRQPVPTRRFHMASAHRDVRVAPSDGNGRGTTGLLEGPSVGDLFKSLSRDSSHLIRQEMNLARTELRETGTRIAHAAAKLGVAVGIAIPGLLAVTAFLVVGLGDLMDNYWAAALIVGVVLSSASAILAKRALNRLKEAVGVPQTIGTLREDAGWAKAEAQAFKREITA